MKRIVRAPLLHFVLLGGALFAIAPDVSRGRWAQARFRPLLTIPAAAIEGERRAFIAHVGRTPTAAETTGLVEMLVDDELLWREAVALRLDHDDPIVRRRLVHNLRFLHGSDATAPMRGATGATDADDGKLYAEALALGLDRSDEVIRRRLIERMRLLVQQRVRIVEPTDAEIDAYATRNHARFAAPERVGLTQIFLSRERRGRRLTADAQALLARLVTTNVPPAAAIRFGDPGLTPARLPPQSGRNLRRRFGAAFAERVPQQAPGGWGGPVPSAYGLHLVWVHEAVPSHVPSPENIRASARELLLAERADAALREELQRLRDRYALRVADGTTDSAATRRDAGQQTAAPVRRTDLATAPRRRN